MSIMEWVFSGFWAIVGIGVFVYVVYIVVHDGWDLIKRRR